MELAASKSSDRVNSIQEICKELPLLPHDFVVDQQNAILAIISKAMKRGTEQDQTAAVRMATLTAFRLGRKERFSSEISNLFSNLLNAKSAATVSTKASICTALSLIELLDIENGNDLFVEPTMELFRQIFLQNQSTAAKDSNESTKLRTKALEAWGLLLTLCSSDDVRGFVKGPLVGELMEILSNDGNGTELRVACGHLFALLVERGRISDKNFLKSEISEICSTIGDVMNDRKNVASDQRKALRDVIKYLEVRPNTFASFSDRLFPK